MHRHAEVALPLRHGRQSGEVQRLRDAPVAFVIGKEEQLVAPDGTADGERRTGSAAARASLPPAGLKKPVALSVVLRRYSYSEP